MFVCFVLLFFYHLFPWWIISVTRFLKNNLFSLFCMLKWLAWCCAYLIFLWFKKLSLFVNFPLFPFLLLVMYFYILYFMVDFISPFKKLLFCFPLISGTNYLHCLTHSTCSKEVRWKACFQNAENSRSRKAEKETLYFSDINP